MKVAPAEREAAAVARDRRRARLKAGWKRWNKFMQHVINSNQWQLFSMTFTILALFLDSLRTCPRKTDNPSREFLIFPPFFP